MVFKKYIYVLILFFLLMFNIFQLSKLKSIEHYDDDYKNKNIAICICGCVRSFSRKPYRDGLIKLLTIFPNADVFLYLKTHDKNGETTLLNSVNGVDEFMKTINIMKNRIIKIVFFEALSDSRGDKSTFHAQIRNVNACLNLAEQHKHYDYYLRMRPDYVILDTNLPATINDNVIYTDFHHGSPAGDMVYLFSNKLKKQWWDKYVMDLLKTDRWYNHITPEFILMQDMKVQAGPQFFGGLLRNNEDKLIMFHGDKKFDLRFNDVPSLDISEKSYIEKEYLDMIINKLKSLNIQCITKSFIN